MSRLCIGCEHFGIDFGSLDYSDLTPGDTPAVLCMVTGFPTPEPYDLTRETFRNLLRTAETCDKYVFRVPMDVKDKPVRWDRKQLWEQLPEKT